MGPILLKKITEELNATLKGGIISKIHQPGDRLLILEISIQGRVYDLLISTEAIEPRVHLSEKKYPDPKRTLRFCAFLRRHITGALVDKVRALEGQRIAEIRLKRKDKPNESVTLIVELTGKSANIILTDSKNIVMDALKYFRPENSPRIVSPGLNLNPLTGKSSAKETLIEKNEKTWNESAQRYFDDRSEKRENKKLENDLRRALRKAEERLIRKIKNLEGDIKKAEDNIQNSSGAELLIAKKGKRTIKIATGSIIEVKKELDNTKSLYQSIEKVVSKNKSFELGLVRDKLVKIGYIRD